MKSTQLRAFRKPSAWRRAETAGPRIEPSDRELLTGPLTGKNVGRGVPSGVRFRVPGGTVTPGVSPSGSIQAGAESVDGPSALGRIGSEPPSLAAARAPRLAAVPAPGDGESTRTWPRPWGLKKAARWTRMGPRPVELSRAPAHAPDHSEAAERRSEETPRRREGNTALELYMREVKEMDLLTPEEEADLARRVQAGDERARERMIWANLRLVVKIARGYENLGLPLLDLINEGNIGLMKAVERFDVSKGAKLSTYSSWWIKQSMRRALASQSTTIRLPVHAMDQICHLRRAARKLRGLLGHEPTDEDLARHVGLPVRRVHELRDTPIHPASFDAPLGNEDSCTLAELVADEHAENPAQGFEDRSSLEQMSEMISRLPHREATIIRARFGLDDGREKSLEEIGTWFDVTRERIRQLQNTALNKLRRMLEDPPSFQVSA